MGVQKEMIKAVLLHLGPNGMAGDSYLDEGWRERNPKVRHWIASKEMNFDKKVWDDAVKLMKEGDLNTIVINMRDGMVFPSHPELAIKGSWTPDEMRAELKRLRGMGFDVIPKLNFSTTHSAWMKQYRRVVSSPEYYKVCAELIHDVCEVFGKPSHFHIGMDEEWPDAQRDEPFVVCRRGDLWLHDARFLVDEVEKHGVRCMMWSDIFREEPEKFKKCIPKSVLVQNWYYSEMVDENDFPKPINFNPIGYYTYGTLEKAGYDQLPTASNWCGPKNMGRTIIHCRKTIAPERLKGFMTAPWHSTTPESRERIMTCIAGFIGALEGAGLRSTRKWGSRR